VWTMVILGGLLLGHVETEGENTKMYIVWPQCTAGESTVGPS
jgi:hypothetical protein